MSLDSDNVLQQHSVATSDSDKIADALMPISSRETNTSAVSNSCGCSNEMKVYLLQIITSLTGIPNSNFEMQKRSFEIAFDIMD